MNKIKQQTIIKIESLSRQFANKQALKDVSLQVNKGQVLGIVGENGAGKTTLIKHVLGLYQAQQGSVSVFGKDPVLAPEKVLAKIGYLSEQPEYPDWMTVAQFIHYMSAFYPNWDHQYAQQLVETFQLDTDKKIQDLSKGQKARVGLCVAQAHKPELLLLDEPSSGLDPIVRKDILTAIIRTVADEGRTVILSSHFLDEVERVCDHLVMFSQGQVLLSASMDKLLQQHYQISIKSNENQSWKGMTEIFKSVKSFTEWQLYCFGKLEDIINQLKKYDVEIISHQAMTLEQVFMTRSPEQKKLSEEAA